MRILINEGLQADAIDILKGFGYEIINQKYDYDALMDIIQTVDVLIVKSHTRVDRKLLAKGHNGLLKMVVRAGVGTDNIDMDYANQLRIEVYNTPNASTDSVAELALGHLLVLARNINKSIVSLRDGQWNKAAYLGTEIKGKTLGIIGFGRIGKCLAKKADALGMNIIYNDLYDFGNIDVPGTYHDLKDLLPKADFISIHTPYLPEPLIKEEEFILMKPSAYIINAARGGVIDENALLTALDNDYIKGAAIDVFLNEPHPNERICNHPNVSVTPHLGGSTHEAFYRIGMEITQILQPIQRKNVI